MKTLKALKDELLADAETHAAYEALAEEFTVARELIAARTRAGMAEELEWDLEAFDEAFDEAFAEVFQEGMVKADTFTGLMTVPILKE